MNNDDTSQMTTFSTPAKEGKGPSIDILDNTCKELPMYRVYALCLFLYKPFAVKLPISKSNSISVNHCNSNGDVVRGVDLVKHALDDVRSKDLNKTIIIVQASGFGKTKAVVDLGKLERVIYFPCAVNGRSSHQPAIVAEIYKDLLNAKETKRERICECMLYCLLKAAKDYPTPVSLYSSQFESSEFYFQVASLWAEAKKSFISPKKVVFESQTSSPPQQSTPFSFDISEFEACTIVFDECVVFDLCCQEDQNHPIRCLSRIINSSRSIYGIFLSTNVSGEMLCHRARSSRATEHDATLITGISFTDHFFSKGHPFLLGRPLWNTLKTDCNLTDSELIKEARDLLFQPSIQEKSDLSLSVSQRLNISLLVRFNFYPSKHNCANLSAKHLAPIKNIIIRADEDPQMKRRAEVISRYDSEPILAEVSSREMATNYVTLSKVLSDLSSSVNNVDPFIRRDEGDRGERVACIALQLVLDSLRVHRLETGDSKNFQPPHLLGTMSSSILALDFLNALKTVNHDEIGSNSKSLEINTSKLDGFTVNFSHFTSFPRGLLAEGETLIAFNHLAYLYDRCCAIFCPSCYKGIDIIIPMKNIATTSYGIISVQVKNYTNVISAHKIEGLLLDVLASTRAITDRPNQECTIMPEHVVAMVFCTGKASESTNRTNIVRKMEYPRHSNRQGKSSVGVSNLVMSLDWNDFSSANMTLRSFDFQDMDRHANNIKQALQKLAKFYPQESECSDALVVSKQHAEFGGLAYFLSEKFQRRLKSDADADVNNPSATTNIHREEYGTGLEIDSIEIRAEQQARGDDTSALNSYKRKHGDAINGDNDGDHDDDDNEFIGSNMQDSADMPNQRNQDDAGYHA